MYDIRNLNIWKEETETKTGAAFEELGIEELNLSVRAYNCLKRAQCQTIGDVLRLAESRENGLMQIRNLGTKSAEEILAKLEELRKNAPPVQSKRTLIKPSRKMLDTKIEEFPLSESAKRKLRESGIRIVRDLYRGSDCADPGWFVVRELFEELQKKLAM
jgi:DNA-directed RNA polymerase alpha subunit